MRNQLNRNIALMNAVNNLLEKMVLRLGTRATKFVKSDYNIGDDEENEATGLISPLNVVETVEYGLRNADNLCNCLNNGTSAILFDDWNNLVSSDGTLLPTGR